MAIKDSGILTSIHGKDLGLNADRELVMPQGAVMPKESAKGIKVDKQTPTFPWFDLLGNVNVDTGAASNKPTFATYKDSYKGYQFAVDDWVFMEYHIPHDYLKGSDLHVHAHWSHNAADVVSGSATWEFKAMYAKGHNQAAFSAEKTTSIAAAASIVQYQHMISETQISAVGGAGGLLNTNDLEPDGVILMRVRLAANTISAAHAPFLHFVDLHYQSTGIGTKQKAPDFYS